MKQYTRNILKVYSKCKHDELQHGLTWYRDANQWCNAVAIEHKLPLHVVVGVVAALSPTNRWSRNLIDANNLIETFINGGYVEDCKVCTYNTMRDKAWHILQSIPHTPDDVAFILNGAKITDFFRCIMGDDVCVIDGHAWCIANNDRRKMQNVPNIGKKLREQLQKSYSSAAKKHGMTAYEMQAATWVTWRRLHGLA